jgi:two-component system chemotaxis sensor kinase CheA
MAICPDIPAEHRQAFLSEAEDNLKVWEQTLLSLEKEPTDKELLNKLFRAVHTLKGCAGFVSCDLMLELTHELESVLQGARDQGMALGPDVIELMFAGLDLVKAMTTALAAGTDFQGDLQPLIARARSFGAPPPLPSPRAASRNPVPRPPPSSSGWRSRPSRRKPTCAACSFAASWRKSGRSWISARPWKTCACARRTSASRC